MTILRVVGVCTGMLLSAGCGDVSTDTILQVNSAPVAEQAMVRRPLLKPPLSADGNQLVDARGRRVRLQSVNWFGGSDVRFIPGGLDRQHRTAIARLIVDMGFNSVRLPFSNEMIRRNPVVPADHVSANPDLAGKRALEVYEAVVAALDAAGIAVILNNHTTSASWCCDINPCEWQWQNVGVPFCRVHQSEEEWLEDWENLVARLHRYPLVVGADLRNEIRALVGVSWERWADAVERAAKRIHAVDPTLLIMVEGLSASQNFTGMHERPLNLEVRNKLVFAPHVYWWFWERAPLGKVYGNETYEEFSRSLDETWGFLAQNYPVWIGEFGLDVTPNDKAVNCWTNLLRYIKQHRLGYGYWPLNAERVDHGREGYGLLDLTWSRPRDDFRLRDLATLGH